MNTKPESNPYLPRVNSQRLLNLLDVGHNAPATGIVTKPVRMGVAGDFRFPDADHDGVPDLFDCEPFNPEADGWLGDTYKAAKSYFTPNYAVAASRRASVRQAVSGGARAAASYVRHVPARPTQVISRHVARHISRRAAPVISRIVSRPSPAQIKRVTAAAFPKTAAMITGAAELRKVVGAMRPPTRADLAHVARTTLPPALTLPTIMGVAAAAETSQRQQEQRAQPKGMWETTLLTLKPITQPLGIYGAPVEKREYRKEVGEYETAHKKAQDMAIAHEATWGGMTEGTAEQVAAAEGSIAAIEAQKLVAEGEYSDVERSFEKYQAERGEYAWAKLDRMVSEKIPTLYDISDAGAPFREKHKKQIDVVRGAYIKHSPEVAKDVIYPFAGGLATGTYDWMQKYPVSFALTLGAFMAAPYVLGGAGAAARGVGLASKVGKIPVVGGVLQKHGMSIGLRAVEGLWAGSVGLRVHAAPTWEEKGRVSGKILASEALPYALAVGAPGLIAPVTPIRVKADGYSGYGFKGFKKPVTTTVEVPALQRGGVYEADLLRKPPTTTKEIVTGYVREPIPIIGIRRASYTTEGATEGIAEVTTTWKGLQFGRRWTPAEITKIKTVEGLRPTSEGVRLQMAEKTTARVGQFRYTKESAAVGRVKDGYFLPEGEGVLRLTTAEKGLVPTRDPLLMITEGVPTPTRVYAEYMRPYTKIRDMPLYGSPARMQWIEMGTRKISYGIRGGLGQPRLELGGWGKPPTPRGGVRGMKFAGADGIPPIDTPLLPTYQPGIAAGEAVSPAYFSGFAPPKQIPPDIFFKTTGVPASSRFYDFGHAMRRTRVTPLETPPIKPVDRGIGAVTPRIKSKGVAPIPELVPEAARVAYAEPTVCVGGVCYKDVGAPVPQRVKTTTRKRRFEFAEPEVSPTVEAILGEVKTESTIDLLTPKPAPKKRKQPTKVSEPEKLSQLEDMLGVKLEDKTKLAPTPIHAKRKRPTPTPTIYPDHLVYPDVLTHPEPLILTKPKEKRKPVPTITPHPEPLIYAEPPISPPSPPTLTQPKEMRRPVPFIHIATEVMEPRRPIYVPPPPVVTKPPPPRIIVPPPPPPVVFPLIGGDGGMAGGSGLRGKGRRAWDIENPLITLDEFFASPPQPKKPVKPVGMIPMIPAGVV